MSSWCYGLVKIKDELVLCEIYNYKEEKGKIVNMVCPVSWSELKNKSTRTMLIEDLKGQLEGYPHYNFKFKSNDKDTKPDSLTKLWDNKEDEIWDVC